MIDWDRVRTLKEEVGPEDFDEVLDLFFSEVEEMINGLPPSSQPPKFADDMHFLKGAAMNLGFSDMSQKCHEGEITARDSSGAEMSYGELTQVYAASKAQFMKGLPDMDRL